MRVLVTGRGGQLGRELRRAAWPGGFEVHAPPESELDVTDAAQVARAFENIEPELVVNAAAYTAVDRAEEESQQAFAANRDGAELLARHAARVGAALVHVSTDYVFDGTKSGAYTEDDPIAPLGVYGASKAAGEERVRAVLDEHVIVRTSWVFSAHGHNFVKTMLRLGAERALLRVVDDQRGKPTPAADLARVLVAVTERIASGDRSHFGTYHYAGTPVTTWYGFAESIFELWAVRGKRRPRLEPIPASAYPTLALRPTNSELDCHRLLDAFGVEQRPWRAGLEAVLEEIEREKST